MYYRLAICCSIGFASASSFIGLDGLSEVPREVRRFENALSSMPALEQFIQDIESPSSEMFLGHLADFLRTPDGLMWINSHRALLGDTKILSAFDLIVSVLNSVGNTNHFDNTCAPPLASYFGKDLNPDEIRYLAGLYSLTDEWSDNDLAVCSRVTDFEKIFRPIIHLFHRQCKGDGTYCNVARYACLEGNVLRRIAALKLTQPTEFVKMVSSAGDGPVDRTVLLNHRSQILADFASNFAGLARAMEAFETTRTGKSRDDMGYLKRFVWYYVGDSLCQAAGDAIFSMQSPEEYDEWVTAHVGSNILDDKFWAAICALNSASVRAKRNEFFTDRSPQVQQAIAYIDADPTPCFQALKAEVQFRPSTDDKSILQVPAIFGKAYRRDYMIPDPVVAGYPAIATEYLSHASSEELSAVLKLIWITSLQPLYIRCMADKPGSCFDLSDAVTLNPFTLAAFIGHWDCESIIEKGGYLKSIFESASHCPGFLQARAHTLIQTLIRNMDVDPRTARSTTVSIKDAFTDLGLFLY